MSDIGNSDTLELVLKTRFEGIEQAAKAAKALRDYANAEKQATAVVEAATEAQNRLNEARDTASRQARARPAATRSDSTEIPFPQAPPPNRGQSTGSNRDGGGSSQVFWQIAQKAISSGTGGAGQSGDVTAMLLRNLAPKAAGGAAGAGSALAEGVLGGLLAEAAPLAAVFIVVKDAVDEFVAQLRRDMEASHAAMMDFRESLATTRGNTASAAQLSVYGELAGVNLDADARRMHSAISGGDPRAMLWASRLGLPLIPDIPGHPRDRGADLMKALMKLRSMNLTPEQQADALESLGMSDAQPLLDLSPKSWGEAQTIVQRRKMFNSLPLRRLDAESAFQKNRYNELLDENSRARAVLPTIYQRYKDEIDANRTDKQWEAIWKQAQFDYTEDSRKPSVPMPAAATDFARWVKQQQEWTPMDRILYGTDPSSPNYNDKTNTIWKRAFHGWQWGYDYTKDPDLKPGPAAMPQPPGPVLPPLPIPNRQITIHGDPRSREAAAWAGANMGNVPAPMGYGPSSIGQGSELTEAVQLLVATLLQTNRNLTALVGGGQRAAGALPERLYGRNLALAVNMHALHQGALG